MLVLMKVWVASAEQSSLLALNLEAMLLITLVAEGPVPPVHANINGLKAAFSTSMILCSYLSFSDFPDNHMNLLYYGQLFARGLNILTSKYVFLNLDSHREFALMSNLASSSVIVDFFYRRTRLVTAEDWAQFQHHNIGRLIILQMCLVSRCA